jgi:hypothetical protein
MMAGNGSSNKLQSLTEPAPHHGKKYGLFNASNNGDTFSLQFLSPSIRASSKSGHGVELNLRLTTLVDGDRVRPVCGAFAARIEESIILVLVHFSPDTPTFGLLISS